MSGTGTGLTWDELDRLADYTAGVLTGADADEITHLINTDERWAVAHAELIAAQPAVTAALHSAAAAPAPIPADVAARLDAALANARPGPRAVIQGGRPHQVRPDRRERRSPVLMRVAAGVLVLAGLGGGLAVLAELGGLPGVSLPAMDNGSALSEDADNPLAEGTVAATDSATPAATRYLASGTDYNVDSLPQLVAEAPPLYYAERANDMGALAVDDSLAEVATRDGLARCLAELRLVHPGVVVVVDFARFEGQPAIVVLLQHGSTSTVVAVGAGCGTDGLDELASVTVE